MQIELLLLGAAILLVLSIFVSKASNRFGIPSLLIFLLIGMLAGSEGPGQIYFDSPLLAQSLGVVALAFILFSGGLDTDWKRIRPVLWHGLSLSNIAVILSAVLVSVFAMLVLGLTFLEGLLLGAIISSTDAAAVFSVLRTRGVNLKGDLEPLIELESGTNDPMAVFLTIGLTQLLINGGGTMLELVPMFIIQMVLGAAAGYAMGRLMTFVVNRVRLQADGLYPVLTVGMVALTYGATALAGGNGFLAVYIAGLVMGNRNFVHRGSLMRFHDGLAWLMQIAMFLALGLLVFPSELLPVIGMGLLASIFLIFVARPLSVFGALAFTQYTFVERLMVSWAGLRGAVPIVLATFPLLAGVPRADLMFNLVFFIVLTSVLIQGATIGPVARWLKVNNPKEVTYHYPLEFVPQISASSQLMEVQIPSDSVCHRRSIIELGLPSGALVVLISRDGDGIVPSGATVLEQGDKVLVLAERESMEEIRAIFDTCALPRRRPVETHEPQPSLADNDNM